MTWASPMPPLNGVYLRWVAEIEKAAGQRAKTCALCGCLFLPTRGSFGDDCYPCYRRERDLMEDAVDRAEYAKYVEVNGPLIDRWGIAPKASGPVEPTSAEPQLDLFGEAA